MPKKKGPSIRQRKTRMRSRLDNIMGEARQARGASKKKKATVRKR